MKRNTGIMKITILGLVIMTFMVTGFAQQHGQHGNQRKNIESQKIALITERLQLTPEEAQVFWPVYNEFTQKRKDLIGILGESSKSLREKDVALLTDEEAEKLADNELIEAQKILDLKKEYHIKYKSILSPRKVLMLYKTEKEFRRILLDRLRKRQPQGR